MNHSRLIYGKTMMYDHYKYSLDDYSLISTIITIYTDVPKV